VPKEENPKLRIAVLDFTNGSRNPGRGMGKYFADRLTHELFRRSRFELVERGEVNYQCSSEEISNTDMLSIQEIKKVGAKLGVDLIIEGTITEYQVGNFEEGPNKIGVFVKVVSCRDGKLVAIETNRQLGKDDMVLLSETAISNLADSLISALRNQEILLQEHGSISSVSLERGKDP
jgi:TolB-like protein